MGGIEVVDPRYVELLARAREVFASDDRVVRVDPGGSIGYGEADAWSDLDVHLYVRPDDHDAVVAQWPEWLAKITPTVFARTPIMPFIVNAVTADGLTLDVAVLRDDWPEFTRPTGYQVGLVSGRSFDDQGAAVEYAVAEMLRCLCGPFVTDFGRDEPVRSITGAGHLVGLLTTVMLAETKSPPANAKRPSASLTEEQLATLAALPPLRATRDDVSAFNLSVAGELFRRARPLFDRHGLAWPSEFEAVARARVQQLGLAWT